ncbi:Adaptive-response sensory-kinase SasA [Alphaproteobacteria bacterium SO-S41]|nr:Adaptive-response sensory-kinase SasA [Alphaproteobacteria bacterium SO-S41]
MSTDSLSYFRWLFSKDLLRDGETLPVTPLTKSILATVICIGVATALRAAVDPFVTGVPFVFYFPAILLATLAGGLKAGGMSLVLATFISRFAFMAPRWSIRIDNASDAIGLTLFVLCAGAVVAVVHVFRISIAGHHKALGRERAAQAARADAERLSNALVENTPAGFAVINPAGDYVMLNDAFRRAGPPDAAKVVGRNMRDSTTPIGEQIARLVDAVLSRKEATENDEVSWSDSAAPGQRRSLLASAFPILDASGAIALVGITRVEITERRRWEQALQFREEHFRLAIEAAALGTWDYDLVNRAGSWSSLAAEMHGLPPDTDPAIDTLVALFDKDSIRAGEAALGGAMTTGELSFEYRVATGPAEGRRMLSQGRLTRNAQGRPVRVIGIVRDITGERENAERERSQLQLLQGMTNALPQLAWMADATGRLTWLNDRWFAYTAMNPGTPEDEGWRDSAHPDDQAMMVEAWSQSVRTGAPFEVEIRIRRFDGLYRPFLVRARAVRGAGGRIAQWFGSCTDITVIADVRDMLTRDRAELERLVAERTTELTNAIAELQREADRRIEAETLAMRAKRLDALGQLTGGIAHDFNNFLAAILAGADLASRHAASDPARSAQELATVKTSAMKASGLVRRLLAFARQQPLEPRSVDANLAIAEIADILRRTAGDDVQLEIVPAAGPCEVTIDVTELENALLNLVANARDAMPDGGVVRIVTRLLETAGRVEITVSDNGPGISEDVRKRVFEPFFTTKPDGKGTGLGLAQVYGFIKQSGGDVQLNSPLDGGTSIRLLLPWTATAPAPTPADRRPRVLVVEDEALLALSAADELERAGYVVAVAGNLKEADKALAEGPAIDACLIDIGLPDGRGDLWARALRDRQPLCAIVVSTGYERTARPFSPGDVRLRYLGKPFLPQAIPAAFTEMGVAGVGAGAPS